MRKIGIIFKRELQSQFVSPAAYAIITGFLFLTGVFFYIYLVMFVQEVFLVKSNFRLQGSVVNINEYVVEGIFSSMIFFFLFIAPLLTMRTFAEERRRRTDELLFTAPLSVTQLVLGKYLACLFVLVVTLALTGYLPVFFRMTTETDMGPVFTGYLGLLLAGSSFVSLGLFASSLTENQIVAALLALVGLLVFWVIGWAGTEGQSASGVFSYLSQYEHFKSFPKGIVDTRDVFYHGAFTALFLFATHRVVDSTRWR